MAGARGSDDGAHGPGPRGAVEHAAAALRAGGVVLLPTETFYGLCASIESADALSRLAALKRRSEAKAMPIICADEAQALALWSAPIPELARLLMARFWPGPLTIVLPPARALGPLLASPLGVGVRVSASPIAREVAALAGPFVASSANLAGQPEVSSVEALAPELRALADHLLDGGPTPGGAPSTVVALAGGALRILRAGALAPSLIEEVASRHVRG